MKKSFVNLIWVVTFSLFSLNTFAESNNQQQSGFIKVAGKKSSKTNSNISALDAAKQRAAKLSQNDRSGKDFTKAGKQAVIDLNKAENGGVTRCTNCGVTTVAPQQSRKGVTPPSNETHVDHVNAKSKGGSGTPNNGQVLCRKCNLDKSNK